MRLGGNGVPDKGPGDGGVNTGCSQWGKERAGGLPAQETEQRNEVGCLARQRAGYLGVFPSHAKSVVAIH